MEANFLFGIAILLEQVTEGNARGTQQLIDDLQPAAAFLAENVMHMRLRNAGQARKGAFGKFAVMDLCCSARSARAWRSWKLSGGSDKEELGRDGSLQGSNGAVDLITACAQLTELFAL